MRSKRIYRWANLVYDKWLQVEQLYDILEGFEREVRDEVEATIPRAEEGNPLECLVEQARETPLEGCIVTED